MREIGKSKIEYPDTYIVVDIEATGLNPETERLIEVAAIKYVNHKEVARFSELINPLRDQLPVDLLDKDKTIYISDFIENLTGISNRMLHDARGEKDVLKEYIKFIGDDMIIGHNVRFDIRFIYDALLRDYGVLFQNDYIDTLKIARKLLHEDLKRYRLMDLADHYHIDYSHAHRAVNDCEITHDVYEMMMEDIFNDFGTIENYRKKRKNKK